MTKETLDEYGISGKVFAATTDGGKVNSPSTSLRSFSIFFGCNWENLGIQHFRPLPHPLPRPPPELSPQLQMLRRNRRIHVYCFPGYF